jgi:hypothetical protein
MSNVLQFPKKPESAFYNITFEKAADGTVHFRTFGLEDSPEARMELADILRQCAEVIEQGPLHG